MDLRTKALQGVAWSALRNWGSRVVNIVVFTVLARLLSQSAIGLVAYAGVYIAFVRVFVDQGFADAIIQRDELEDAHLDTAFWVNLAMSVAMMGATVAAAPWVAWVFSEPALTPVIQVLAPSFLLAALSGVQEAYIERNLDYQVLAARELIAATAGGTVGVVMAVSGYGVWSLVGMMLVERTAATIVLWTASPWRPGLAVSMRHFRQLFRFGVNILGSNLLYYVNSRADNAIIGYVLGTEALGYYEIAYKIYQNGVDLVTLTVSSVAFSTFSRLQDDLDRMRQGFYTAVRTVSLVSFPAFFGGALLAPEFIGVIFGTKWLPLSAQVFQALAFAGVLQTVFYFNASTMLANGKANWRLWIGIMNAIANVTVFAVAAQSGIVAVAVAFAGVRYLLAPVPLVAVRKLIAIEWRTYLGVYVAPLTGVLVMAAALTGLRATAALPPWGLLAAGVPLGALVYGTTVAIVAPKRLRQIRGLLEGMLPSRP
jgi:PST family polysaccharide transporter